MPILGFSLLIIGLLALFGGFITLIDGILSKNKKMMKKGLFIFLGGAVSLLTSFSLCST